MPQRRRAKQLGEIEWRQVGRSEFAVPRSATFQTGDDSDLPYYLELTIENDGTGPTCRRLVVEQRPSGPPVTTERLREIPVRAVVDHFANSLVMKIADPKRGVSSGLSLPSSLEQVHEASAALDRENTTARRRITDDDLQSLADIYREAQARGVSYVTLAGLRLGITPDQARQWKRKAIRDGLLEKGSNR